jgi:hypothetical protein
MIDLITTDPASVAEISELTNINPISNDEKD